MKGHKEHLATESRTFRRLLQHRYWVATKQRLSRNALDEVLDTLAARARFEGPEHQVFLRVAHAGDKVYVNLCNDNWEAVEISKEGFRVIRNPPVYFVRRPGMLSLPHPSQARDAQKLLLLKTLLELFEDRMTLRLLVAYLVGIFNPALIYPLPCSTARKAAARAR